MKKETEATKPFPLHLTAERHARYKSAAHREEKSISVWLRDLADAACDAMGIVGGEKPKPKSMFRQRELPEHHEEIMRVLKGRPLAEYCRTWGVLNPETGRMEEGAVLIVDESESKADRREREMLERHGEA